MMEKSKKKAKQLRFASLTNGKKVPEEPPENPGELLKWWHMKATQGNTTLQAFLGWMYRYGKGVPEDTVQAVKWFRKAAGQGNAEGQCNLGCMYGKGEGVTKDAAEQGDARAQYNLGEMYLYGDGVPQDYVQAHKWFNLATARIAGEYSPEVIQQAKNESEKMMTGSQVAEARRLAREWQLKTKE